MCHTQPETVEHIILGYQTLAVNMCATGIVDKNIKKYVGRIPSCHNIYSLQRSAILGMAHILRKVLSIKPD